jgi:RHS repeat-associated protein
VTQSAVRTIKPLGGPDEGPPPPPPPTLFEQQYTFYTPELNLMSETTSTSTAATPAIAYDYVWFAGQPLAQIENATGNIAWYVNDHLGTPIRQTDSTGRVLWQAEYEPYGTIYAIRRGEARHQPLRLPGQMAEEGSDLYQNVFRFYRAGWGRYTQSDPIGLRGGHNLFSYVRDNPGRWVDRLGLVHWKCNILYGLVDTPGLGREIGGLIANCTSDCVHRRKVQAVVATNAGGISFASPVPLSFSYSENVDMYDPLAEAASQSLAGQSRSSVSAEG